MRTVVILLTILFFFFQKSHSKGLIYVPHLYHKHLINFYNTTTLQSVKDYSILNNISYLFINYLFTEQDELFLNTAYAFNDGLDKHLSKKGYTLQTYGGDLKGSVENINNTGRNYLLELWYAKSIENLKITGGIIDISSFVDNVKYAQSEQEQFMNSMFVNNPIAYQPSYNTGFVVDYKIRNYKIKFGFSKFNPETGYYSILEFDYLKKRLNLKPYFYTSIGSDYNLNGSGIAWDYTINKNGFWGRLGKNFNENLYHFSIGYVRKNFLYKGSLIGFAYGIVEGNTSQTTMETYYRQPLVKHFWFTLDFQYIKEKREDLVYGLRSEFSF